MIEGLTGRSAIVTGAARGVGLAVARRLIEAGADVLMTDPDEDRLEAEVAALNEGAPQGRASGFCCNLRERLDMSNLLAAAVEAQDGLDILIDANLLAEAADPLDGVEALERALAQNVTARLRLAQLAAKRMRTLDEDAQARGAARGRDRAILFLGAAHDPGAGDLTALAASMGALEALVRGLSLRLAPQGVRVNVLAARLTEASAQTQERRAAFAIGAGMEEAVADAAAFLVSTAARGITGRRLVADAAEPAAQD